MAISAKSVSPAFEYMQHLLFGIWETLKKENKKF
jgi:hypothetical protein